MNIQQSPPVKPAASKPSNESPEPPSLAECENQSRTKGEKALLAAARTMGPSKAYCCDDEGYERESTNGG